MVQEAPRVVHVSSVHRRDDIRIFLKECVALRDAGYDIHLVVADGKGDETVLGIPVHDVGRSQGRMDRMVSAGRRAVAKARELRPAVVHFHDPELLPHCVTLRARGIRTVYDAHEDLPRSIMSKQWIHATIRRLISRGSELVENFCAGRMSAVVGATPTITARFARVNPVTETVCNYPALANAPSPPIRKPEPRAFCYVGALTLHRGIMEMLRAAEAADARLILAGPFESEALKAEVSAMPEWRRVEYLGVVPHAQVWEIMSRSVAGLLMLHPVRNYIESLPIKMYEYMAAGLPIVASDYVGWPDVVRSEKIGLNVDPLDAAAIAGAMQTIMSDPAAAEEMGSRGRDVVMVRYRWENEAGKLLGLYERLLR